MVTDIKGFSANNGTGLKEMEVHIWDEDAPAEAVTVSLDAEDESLAVWRGQTNLQGMEGTIWIDVVATDDYGRKYHVDKVSMEV